MNKEIIFFIDPGETRQSTRVTGSVKKTRRERNYPSDFLVHFPWREGRMGEGVLRFVPKLSPTSPSLTTFSEFIMSNNVLTFFFS